MASSSFPLSLFCAFLLIISPSLAKTSSRPKALLLPVTKDAKTLQYVTQVGQRTPLVPVKLTVDLGGEYMWVNCEQDYTSSTYRPVRFGSAPCQLLNNTLGSTTCYSAPRPGCYNDTCSHIPYNTISISATDGQVGSDLMTIQATDGKNPQRVVSVPRLYFVCGRDNILRGLANGVTGMAGLGRTKVSLPPQLSSYFKFDSKFALCLSSSTRSSGLVFFGNGPYTFLPNVDASSSLTYTPLIINPVSESGFEGDASPKYFIGVTSIKINEKQVRLNTSLLSIDGEGYGGTSISTVRPYTVLESSIYKAIVAAFVKAMPKNVKRVASVAPFGACFRAKDIGSTRVGAAVPSIDFVLQSESVYWRIFGANSMVQVKKNVLCLGFVEAPADSRPRTSIVIGGYQIEDNLLQFDVSKSRLGFSSSLLFRSTTCANFNFTSNA